MKYLSIVENTANDLGINGFDFNIILIMMIIGVIAIYLFKEYFKKEKTVYLEHGKLGCIHMKMEQAIMDFKTSISHDGILTRYDEIALLEVFEVIEREIVDMYKRIIDIEIQLRRIE